MTEYLLETGGISGVANPLTLINPNDIESFNILKDASATAIYGNRAFQRRYYYYHQKKGAAAG
ncbi:MAG: TonB-dependent receptor plug domain-containing protein [Bacteroidia bacterium]|nr:TonB-dependent receptor plug domain-containing protein [Bacteroidia bacterium]